MAGATWNCCHLGALCTPYNHAPCHFMQSHIHKVHVCLAVTCHLHFWQNDGGLLRATAVTQGWNRYQIRVGTKSWPWRRKFSHCSCRDLNPRPFNHKSSALTTELSPLLWCPASALWRLTFSAHSELCWCFHSPSTLTGTSGSLTSCVQFFACLYLCDVWLSV